MFHIGVQCIRIDCARSGGALNFSKFSIIKSQVRVMTNQIIKDMLDTRAVEICLENWRRGRSLLSYFWLPKFFLIRARVRY